MSTRISVQQAAMIAHRSARTVYDWIDAGLLESFQGEYGEIMVDGLAVLVVEETRKRGRPRKTANSDTPGERS